VRTPAEYLRILWRRRYFVTVPLIIISATLGYAIYRLPNVYESSTLIIVDPAKVPTNIAQPVVQVDITSRLGTIRQQVTSRTGLQEIIDKFDLYQELRRSGAPNEMVLEEMRRNIDVNIRSTGAGANAFIISFRGRVPEVVQAVTAELATRFIDANSTEERRRIQATTAQIENRIMDVKARLEKIEAERTDYRLKNPDTIPGTEQSMLGQLHSLNMLYDSQRSSIDALENRILTTESLLATVKAQSEAEPQTAGATHAAEGTLRARRVELETRLKQLKTVFTDKHPEVKEIAAQLEGINKELEDLKGKAEQEKNGKRSASLNNLQLVNLQLTIDAAKRELQQKKSELEQTKKRRNEFEARLNSQPILALGAQKIDRDYETLRKEYDGLVSQRESVMFSAKVANDFNSETFRMQDPAYYPETPAYPKRGMLYPFSLILGLVSGLVIALAVEARYLLTIQDARDVAHYTRLPLLVTVPRIVTDGERGHRALLKACYLVGVVLLVLVAIPVLVKVLQYTKVLNMFAGAY
jgi:polysaccharide chain length determinant protein (PEP-CTERM system associated)